jgi:hypothetical protein
MQAHYDVAKLTFRPNGVGPALPAPFSPLQ